VVIYKKIMNIINIMDTLNTKRLPKTNLLISIIESIYVIYMLNYFKTNIALDHGFILNILKNIGIESDFIKHNTYKIEGAPINMVCPLGNLVSWLLAIFFILRNYIPALKKWNKPIIILLFIGSWMNINVLVYLLPIFICEIYINL